MAVTASPVNWDAAVDAALSDSLPPQAARPRAAAPAPTIFIKLRREMRFIGKSSFFVLEFVGLSVALFLVIMIHDPPELVYLHYVGKHRGFVFCAEKGLCKITPVTQFCATGVNITNERCFPGTGWGDMLDFLNARVKLLALA